MRIGWLTHALIFLLSGSLARAADVDVSLSNSGGVYDAGTNRLYCITGGSITPVNPATGATEAAVVVTSSSTITSSATALTQTGSQFYVAYDSGRRVARIDLPNRTVVEDFAVGVDATGGRPAVSLATLPGETGRVAAVTTDAYGHYWKHEVFQGGVSVATSAATFGSAAPTLFAGDAPGELCAITDPGSSACKLARLVVSGATVTTMASDPMPTANAAQKRGRYLITTGGSIWDSSNHLYIGNPPGFGGPFDLDESGDRMVMALTNGNSGERVLTIVEPSTGAEIHEQLFTLPDGGSPMPLLLCGANRIAHFHSAGIALRDFGVVPQARQVDLTVRQIIGPGRVTVGQPISVSVLVRNASKATAAGATLHWTGMPVGGVQQVLTTSGTATVTSGEVDVALGDLLPDAQSTVTVSFSALSATAPASTATVSCTTPEITTANNTHVLPMTPANYALPSVNLFNGLQTDYDRASRHVFTLMGAGPETGRQASFWAGQIAEIEPESGRIVAFHRVPGRATCFAVQSGRIFAGLRNNGGIVSRALSGGNWTAPTPVGAEATGRPLVPMDVALGLASPETLVVARQRQISVGQSSGFAAEWEPAAAVQGGVVLPSVGSPCSQIESGRDGEVFGVYSTGAAGTFYRFSVNGAGLTKTLQHVAFADPVARLRYHNRACFHGSFFFDNDGASVYGFYNAVCAVPDPDADRLYWFETRSVAFGPAYLRAATRSTRTIVAGKNWSSLPDNNGNFAPFYRGDLLRWGDYGLLGADRGFLQFSEHPDLIPPPPVRVLLPATVAENAGTVSGGGTVELPRPTPSALAVTLTSSHPTRLQVPASVTIPAGGANVAFDITTFYDPVLTGPVSVTVTPAVASGYTPVSGATSLTDVETTVVGVTLPASILENTSAQGTITLATPTTLAFSVTLSSPDARLSLPGSVLIPAGQTSVNFTFQYLDDGYIDDVSNATITATAAGWAPATGQVTMQDNEERTLTVSTGPVTLTEGNGSGVAFQVYLAGQVRAPLTLNVHNSDTTELTLPGDSSVNVATDTSVTENYTDIFPIDDTDKDGAQSVTVTISAPGFISATIPVTVRDNDPASFAWPAITGPVTAGSEIITALRAKTIDGDEVPLSGAIQITASVGGQPGPVFPNSIAGVTTSSSAQFLLTKAGTTTLTATAGDVTGASTPFEVQAGALGKLVWSPVVAPVLPGVPHAFSISAADVYGNPLNGFSGTADLNAYAQTRTDTVGEGSFATSAVLDAAFTRARSQILIRATSLAGAGRIYSLALELLGQPTRPYEDLTIRLKHTAQYYSPTSWDDAGWTVVRHGPWLPAGAGWNTLSFETPFDYDGTSNLYVDISFVNASADGQVLCNSTSVSGFFALYAATNNTSYGLPTTWSGSSPPASSFYRPNLKLGYGTAIAVTPGATPAFVNGAWSGNLTLTGPVPAHVVLQASSGSAAGASDVFDFGLFPPAAPVFDAEPPFTQGTSNTVSWPVVPLAGSYYVERASGSDFTSPVASGWITQTSFTFTGLADGELWYYRVKSRRSDDTSVESAWSELMFSTQDGTGPQILVNGVEGSSGGTLSTIRSSLTLSGTTSDVAGVASVTVAGAAAVGTYMWSSSVNTPASGSAPVVIVATDTVGNQTTRTIMLVRIADANADGLPDDWQQSTGLVGGAVPPADAGPDADPDHDGSNNLMEFARGRHPLVADALAPSIARVPGFLFTPASTLFEYDRRMNVIDLLFEVQSSTDLAAWTVVAGSQTVTPNPDGITEHVSVSISDGGGLTLGGGGLVLPGGGIIILPPAPPPQKFFRLQVTLRP